MAEELKSISLCLLDDLNLKDTLELDKFKIYYPKPNELQALLGDGTAGKRETESYAGFPWARLEQAITLNATTQEMDPGWLRLQSKTS